MSSNNQRSDEIAVMRQALEALEYIDNQDHDRDFLDHEECDKLDDAITSLRQAIAEAEKQKSVCPHIDEPQGCYRVRCQLGGKCVNAQPKREWVGLTGEMLITAAQSCLSPHQYDHFEALLESDLDAHNRLARAIEAKLKEKNYG